MDTDESPSDSAERFKLYDEIELQEFQDKFVIKSHQSPNHGFWISRVDGNINSLDGNFFFLFYLLLDFSFFILCLVWNGKKMFYFYEACSFIIVAFRRRLIEKLIFFSSGDFFFVGFWFWLVINFILGKRGLWVIFYIYTFINEFVYRQKLMFLLLALIQ